MAATFSIASWNVNGVRASADKGLRDWLQRTAADVVCLQEVRALPGQIPVDLRDPPGWHAVYAPAERPGYSGVATWARRPWDELRTGLGDPRFDAEGRLLGARFGRLWVLGGYFPNGNGKDRDLSRIPYKLEFYETLRQQLQPLLDAGAPVVVLGDWNTAPQAIDLARPKENEKTSGFRPEEREALQRWIDAGWTDAFRHLHPQRAGAYSWWSQRPGVRAKNIGWRIDLALISPAALAFLRGAEVHPEVLGSDHCPISVEFDAAILQA
jgi:exodeoxyribonuclease-3